MPKAKTYLGFPLYVMCSLEPSVFADVKGKVASGDIAGAVATLQRERDTLDQDAYTKSGWTEQVKGAPRVCKTDIMFLLALYRYVGGSARRVMELAAVAKQLGYVQRLSHFNTLLNYAANDVFNRAAERLLDEPEVKEQIFHVVRWTEAESATENGA